MIISDLNYLEAAAENLEGGIGHARLSFSSFGQATGVNTDIYFSANKYVDTTGKGSAYGQSISTYDVYQTLSAES